MAKKTAIIQLLKKQGLMPLFYHAEVEASIGILEALYLGGARIIEYTNRGDAALENFKLLRQLANQKYPDLFLGAGTIKNAAAAELFIAAGADFLVSPALATEIHSVALTHNTLWIPGCMTPTEILQAENLGILLVKLFPGNLLGPVFVQAVKELFPAMLFMPTGGVDTSAENLEAWLYAGVCAVGMGSKLLTTTLIAHKNYPAITILVAELLEKINHIKSSN